MKIAYLISVYKGDNKEYFKTAIHSILNQKTKKGYEIRIYLGIDGDLDSDFLELVLEFEHKFHKIVKSDQNIGLGGILNLMIDKLDNEDYLFRMDADDICKENRTNLQLDFLQKNSNCIAVGSSMDEINPFNQVTGFKKTFTGNTIKRVMNYRNPFNHPTMAFRGDFFKLVGKYNSKLRKCQDYELWMRATNKGYRLDNIEESVLSFRVDDFFYFKRNSIISSKIEFRIVYNYIKQNRTYIYIPIITLKFLIRLLPARFSKFFYKIIRKL